MIQRAISICLLVMTALAGAAEDIVIADFEGRDYGEWTSAGEAFGKRPCRGTLPGQMKVTGYEGKAFVNSYRGGDGSTGTLTSPPFAIERQYINFLVGGGKYPGKTCINLMIDGGVVRTATGPNDKPGGVEHLDWCTWNVKEFMGRKAVLQIVDERTEGWGHINVDHIVQSNESYVLPDIEKHIKVTADYLFLPVKTDAKQREVRLFLDGELVRYFDIELTNGDPDFWAKLEIRPFAGAELVLKAPQWRSDGSGLFDRIVQGAEAPDAAGMYKEALRPQFHFTPARGWTNDPNGLVFYKGEYHLFFQHNPFGWRWGNMTWGHAVSPDLVHWTELDDAIHPDALGTIYSGSAVVDYPGSLGIDTAAEKAICCFYTSAGAHAPEPVPFTQSLAYSIDRGRSWTKHGANPVLEHILGANRDPKVIWHEPTKHWVMALYLDGHDYVIFRSPNLIDWERTCDLTIDGVSECPDIFQLPLDGDTSRMQWVYWGANGTYVLGDFDGKVFTQEGEARHLYDGGAAYAAQSWSDIPEEDGRRIQIAWLRVDFPDMPFNQQLSFPVELTLRTAPDGIRMFAEPVSEIEGLYEETWEFAGDLKPGDNPLADAEGELFDIVLEMKPGGAEEVHLAVRGQEITYDAAAQQLVYQGKKVPLPMLGGAVKLRVLVDRASVEIFGNDGWLYLPAGTLLDLAERSVALQAEGGTVKVTKLAVHRLRSIWP